jgi:hypothetical protein
MEVIAMVGPLVYDLAKLHVEELLAERAHDRLAAACHPEQGSRVPKLDLRRLWLSPRQPSGTARATA